MAKMQNNGSTSFLLRSKTYGMQSFSKKLMVYFENQIMLFASIMTFQGSPLQIEAIPIVFSTESP